MSFHIVVQKKALIKYNLEGKRNNLSNTSATGPSLSFNQILNNIKLAFLLIFYFSPHPWPPHPDLFKIPNSRSVRIWFLQSHKQVQCH